MATETPAQPNLDLTTLTWIMADLEDTLTTLRAARDMAQAQGQWEDALRFSHETVALGKWAQHIIRTYSGKDHAELMEGAKHPKGASQSPPAAGQAQRFNPFQLEEDCDADD